MNDHRGTARIAELARLPAGWLDGAGSPITTPAVSTALLVLPGLPNRDLGIFPTEEGGIAFEFKRNNWDYTVECAPDGSAEIYGIEIGGPAEIEARPYTEHLGRLSRYRPYLPSFAWLLIVMGAACLMAAWLAS